MRHLVVENFGPVTKADLQLKEYNFLIGGQGVGKSTLAKLLSIVSDYNLYLFLARTDREKEWTDFLGDYGIQDYIRDDSLIEYRESGQYMIMEDNLVEKDYSIYLYVEGNKADLEVKSEGRVLSYKELFPILTYLIVRRLNPDELQKIPDRDVPEFRHKLTDALRYVLYIPAERIMHAFFPNLLPALTLVKETVTKNMLYFSIEYNNANFPHTNSSII